MKCLITTAFILTIQFKLLNAQNVFFTNSDSLYIYCVNNYINSYTSNQITNLEISTWFGMDLINYLKGSKLIRPTTIEEVSRKKNEPKIISRIIPLRFKDGMFYIYLIKFRVEKKNKFTYNLVNLGGIGYYFEYIPDKAILLLDNIK